MNSSATVMLFEENGVRPVRVQYDPDNGNNRGATHTHFFKCVDPDVKVGDLVIVTTNTRHGFTVAKVEAIGFADVPVDFDNTAVQWGWVAAKFDQPGFSDILASEKKLVGMVSETNANKMRADLQASMGLNKVSFEDVFIKRPAALASPHGAEPAAEDVTEAPKAV
jgi:hypothetical protein